MNESNSAVWLAEWQAVYSAFCCSALPKCTERKKFFPPFVEEHTFLEGIVLMVVLVAEFQRFQGSLAVYVGGINRLGQTALQVVVLAS
ncbi:hypothetical protein GHT06_001559 [Daphnia sinensis]|uniref:Uncharacterized protein n=1 Tax=Daphnia sinensis TaxID=1820382 RepID=A0AAD5PMY0_9CRUS|nr:hypothetical protein GHT06_001559 [Daphnia sinensis]